MRRLVAFETLEVGGIDPYCLFADLFLWSFTYESRGGLVERIDLEPCEMDTDAQCAAEDCRRHEQDPVLSEQASDIELGGLSALGASRGRSRRGG